MRIAILKTQANPSDLSPNMRYQENSVEFSQMPNGTSDNSNIKRNSTSFFQAGSNLTMAKKILTKEERLKQVKKVDENKLVYFHSLGLTDRQIAKKFICSPSTIYRWRAKLGLVSNHLSWNGERKNLNELTKAFEDFKKTQLRNAKDRRRCNLQTEREKDRVYANKRRKDNRSYSKMKENNRKCYIKNYASNGKCNFCGKDITIFSNICNSCHAKKRMRNKKGIFVSITDGRKTSPKGDFSNEKEHNINLKDNSNKLSQISSNDETSLNNNIKRNKHFKTKQKNKKQGGKN